LVIFVSSELYLKRIKMVEVVREALREIDAPRTKYLGEVIKHYENNFNPDDIIANMGKRTPFFILLPVEDIRSYPPSEKIEPTIKWMSQYLMHKSYVVGGLDSSWIDYMPHINLPIIILCSGIWLHSYGDGEVIRRYLLDYLRLDERIRTAVKKLERRLIEEACPEINGDIGIIMLDESISMRYAYVYSADHRREIARGVVELLDSIGERGYIPVGVYYTTASDIFNTLSIVVEDLERIPPVRDSTIMNSTLNIGDRSPLFRVKSDLLDEYSLDIVAFYLKIAEKNILRVEFPLKFKDHTEDIRMCVLAQSIIGGGYPLALQRAHEIAVFRREDREYLLEIIARLTRKISPQALLSKKLLRKRVPVV